MILKLPNRCLYIFRSEINCVISLKFIVNPTLPNGPTTRSCFTASKLAHAKYSFVCVGVCAMEGKTVPVARGLYGYRKKRLRDKCTRWTSTNYVSTVINFGKSCILM